MNHERLKPTRLCILFRGGNDMVQRSARNQRPVTLKTCYNTRVLRDRHLRLSQVRRESESFKYHL